VTNPRYDYIVGVQKEAAPPHKLMLPDMAPLTLDRMLDLAPARPAATP